MSHDVRIFIALVSVSVIAMLLIPSVGFPLNDEWMFARSIDNYFESGTIGCEGCTTSGVLLVSIGIVLTSLFGFGFDVLRSAPMAFGALSVGMTYLLLKQFTKSDKAAVAASLVLLSNPIFYNVSHVFMTDIPFLFFTIAGVYFSVRAVKSEDYRFFFLSAAAVSAAMFLRQVAVAVPLAIFLFYSVSTFLKVRGSGTVKIPVNFLSGMLSLGKSRIFTFSALLAVVLPVALFAVVSYHQIQVSGQYYSQEFDTSEPIGVSREGFYNTFSTLVYAGFFFLPVSLLAKKYFRRRSFILMVVVLSAAAAASFVLLSEDYPKAAHMPYLSNILNDNGIGAINIPGQEGKEAYIPDAFWVVLTGASVVAASVLGSDFVRVLRRLGQRPEELFMLTVVAAFMLTVVFKAGGFYDRYILVFVPFMAFLFVDRLKHRMVYYSTAVFIVAMFSLSVVGTFDYVSWQEVRWNEISLLQSDGVPKSSISGGFEFCLYEYGMEHQYAYWKEAGTFDDPGVRAHDWKFCPGEEYVISFSESPSDFVSENEYEVSKAVEYCLFGGFACDEMFVLKSV